MTSQMKPSIPIGELFARVYLDRGALLQDNPFLRNRLEAYLQKNHYKDYAEIAVFFKQEAGLVVATTYLDTYKSVFYNFQDFFLKTEIQHVLSSITLVWRYLVAKYPETKLLPRKLSQKDLNFEKTYPAANAWHAFIKRALSEEHMCYTVDESCGVHFVVDEEFERNRVSIISCLDAPRYAGVKAAFESAHSYIDTQPIDTKAAVRSAFESLEILARLMDSGSKNLNKWMVENKLKILAHRFAYDDVERRVIDKLFDGLAIFVDGLHNYRHGQGADKPVAPSLSMTIYVLASIAATIRLLVAIDMKENSGT